MATMPAGNLIGGKLATDLPLPVQSPQIAANLVDPIRSDGILAQSAASTSVTGTLTETTLTTIAIPAGAMGANGQLRIWTVWSFTNSADTKTLRVRLGGTSIQGLSVTTAATGQFYRAIYNRGASNSQVGFANFTAAPFGTNAAALDTYSIDMSIAQNLTFTGTIGANAGANTITLEAYCVEVLNP